MAESKQQMLDWLANSTLAKGKNHLITHLQGGKLTHKQAILAKCYDCMGSYDDGKKDCEVPNCPLYQFMPYRQK